MTSSRYRIIRLSFLLLGTAAISHQTYAATINAASCSQSNVASAISSASVGDTVQIPAGSCSWSNLSIAKAIHLQGAGKGKTNITLTGRNIVTKQSTGLTIISGFSFSKTGGGNSSFGFELDGRWLTARPIIFRDNDFYVSDSAMFDVSVAGGVIWSKNNFTAGADDSMLKLKADDRQSGGRAGSSASWKTDDTMGVRDTTGTANHYIEDCYFYGGANQVIDADDAARVVFRHNVLDFASFNSHGLATSGIGVRHWEVYNNNFRYASTGQSLTQPLANMNWVIWMRGGTGVIFNNQWEDIAGSYWGNKAEGKFDIRAQQDGSGVSYGDFSDGRAWFSAGKGAYPRQHQLAVNWSSSVQTNGGYYIDPIYIWGNTGTGTSNGGFRQLSEGAWGDQTGYFTEGRDYFNGGAPKPNYTPYPYPHPLITNSPLAAPTNLRFTNQ